MNENVFDSKYQLLSELGSGGMSVVYRCIDLSLNREVALKVMLTQRMLDKNSLLRFQREGKVIATLNHDNIVKVHGLHFTQNQQPYLTMEIVSGQSLAQIIQTTGALNLTRAVKIAHQIASALAYVHAQKIIHRDLKPANIMVDSQNQVKLLDFGIAKILEDQSFKATQTGESIGTPVYMSPEQAVGKSVDAKTDQYSLGCVLFEMLTGRPPYTAENNVALSMAHAQAPIPSVSKFRAQKTPAAIEALVSKLLSKNPEQRFVDMVEVRESLGKLATNSTNSKPKIQPVVVALSLVALSFCAIGLFYRTNLTGKPESAVSQGNTDSSQDSSKRDAVIYSANQKANQNLADYLAAHPRLIELSKACKGQQISDEGLKVLRNYPNIEVLDFGRCPDLTDGCARYLQGLTANHIVLGSTSISDKTVAVFPTLKNLVNIDLTETNITDKACQYLAQCPRLYTVNITGNEGITDAGVKALAPLTKLSGLLLGYTSVKDVAHSLRNENIELLSLNHLTVRKIDFERVAKLKKLQHLYLNKADFKPEDLLLLKSPPLNLLEIKDVVIEPELVTKLKKRFPNVAIRWNDRNDRNDRNDK